MIRRFGDGQPRLLSTAVPLATFKDLCIDAVDARAAAEFWAAAIGLEIRVEPDGDIRLAGPTPAHTVWVDQVPEPKLAKNRVHLDIHGDDAASLVELGAEVVDDASFRWTVMTDPEGAEFCLFVREQAPAYRLYEISVDCADHASMSAWWATLLGGEVGTDAAGDFSWVESIPRAPFDSLVFFTVPEPKTCKNRVHIDLTAPEVGAIVDAGATLLRSPDDEIDWSVLADPEGNEFCVFVRA